MIALALSIAGLLVAPSSPASAASTLEIEAGYGGYILIGHSFPVWVSVTTDRLVRGSLEVSYRSPFGGGRNTVAVPVEVPGGGAKRFLVTMPEIAAFADAGATSVEANLLSDGKSIARSRSVAVRFADDRELVGLLPGVRSGTDAVPAPVPLAIDGGVAAFFAIGEAELDAAPGALGPLGTIATTATELSQLSGESRHALLAWVARGGTLFVDEPIGTRIDGIPDEWQPGADGWRSAVLGRVRLTENRVRAGTWDGLVFPSPRPVPFDFRFGPFGMPQSVGTSLASDAGLRVPKLGWLLVFLMLYTLIVGPVVGVVLNRSGRAELAWVVVPAVAIVFTAGTWAVGQGIRTTTSIAHGTVVESSPAGAMTTSFVGIAARGRNDILVGSDSGDTWSARQTNAGFESTASRTELGSNGPAAMLRLAAGQFAVATVVAPGRAADGGLVVHATSDADGRATGTVRNTSGAPLDEVAVFIGSTGTTLGSLAAGEERAWAVDAQRFGRRGDRDPFDAVDARIWQSASGAFGAVDNESAVNYAAWSASTPLAGHTRPAGVAVAVGWTRSFDAPVRLDGERRRTAGRTAIAGSTPVVPTGPITDMTVRGEPVRGAGAMMGAGPAPGTGLGQTVRFVLPDGVSPRGDLIASMPLAGRVEVWNGRAWVDAGQGGDGVAVPFNGDPLARFDVSVPRSAVVDGQVFLRMTNVAGPTTAGALTMRERS